MKKALLSMFLLFSLFQTFSQDLPCKQKYSNQRCATKYNEDSQGNPHGLAIEYSEDGKIIRKGTFNHGIKNGAWFDSSDGAYLFFGGPYQWYENGTLIVGSYIEITSLQQAIQIKEKQKIASMKVTTTQIDGRDYRVEYQEGSWGHKEGICNIYYPSGKLYKVSNYGPYNGSGIIGEENGPYTFYYENGNTQEKGQYYNSNIADLIEWYYENGKLEQFINYKQGQSNYDKWKKDGLAEFYNNGKLRLRCTYKNDLYHGTLEEYYETGILKSRLNFDEGTRSGLCEWFYPNGKIYTKQFCEKLCDLNKIIQKDRLQYMSSCITGDGSCPCFKATTEEYSETGKLANKAICIFKHDNKTDEYIQLSREGLFEWYDKNGVLETRYNYKDNKKEGEFLDLINSTKKYSGNYQNGKLTGNDSIVKTSYIIDFMKVNKLDGITRSIADTIILSVNYVSGIPAGIQMVYQKGSNKLLLKNYYEGLGELKKTERFYQSPSEEVDKIQYQNCMLTLTDECPLVPVGTPYSIGYAIDGVVTFNYFLQGPDKGKIDYPDTEVYINKIKPIIYRNEKGELMAYLNNLNEQFNNKDLMKIIASDLVTLFESQGVKHKDFKLIKETFINSK
jgi:antitoxin component YwqK of YwqJK toxin-antitoxin module